MMSVNFWLLILACAALLGLNLYLSLGQPVRRRRRPLLHRGHMARQAGRLSLSCRA